MCLSLSSVINNFFANVCLIVLLLLIVKFQKIRKLFNIHVLLFVCLLVTIRSVFTFEFFFTHSIYLKSIYPQIYNYFRTPIFNFKNEVIVLSDVLLFLWLIGSFIFLLRFLINYYRNYHHLNYLENVSDPIILKIVSKINSQFKNPKIFVLKSMPYLKSPFICNFHHPTIVLPQTEYDSKEIELILKHEIYHYYSRHLLLKVFCELLAAIYFWNPFIYLLKKQLYKLLEFNVDYKVTKSLNQIQRIEYMECILKTAKFQYTLHPNACTIAFSIHGRNDVSERIQALLDSFEPVKPDRSILFIVLSTVFVMLPFFIIFEPSKIPFEVQVSSFTLNYETSYLIDNANGTYDLYVDSKYLATVNSIFDSELIIKEREK